MGPASNRMSSNEHRKGLIRMTRLAKALRSRREISRTRRAVTRAIDNAATPAMRDELILMAQRQNSAIFK